MTIQIEIPDPLHHRLSRIAAESHQPLDVLIRQYFSHSMQVSILAHLEKKASHVTDADFEQALAQIPHDAPAPHDRF